MGRASEGSEPPTPPLPGVTPPATPTPAWDQRPLPTAEGPAPLAPAPLPPAAGAAWSAPEPLPVPPPANAEAYRAAPPMPPAGDLLPREPPLPVQAPDATRHDPDRAAPLDMPDLPAPLVATRTDSPLPAPAGPDAPLPATFSPPAPSQDTPDSMTPPAPSLAPILSELLAAIRSLGQGQGRRVRGPEEIRGE